MILMLRLYRAMNNPFRQSFDSWHGYAARSRGGVSTPEQRRRSWLLRTADLTRSIGLVFLPILLILFGAPILILLIFLVFTFAPILVPLANTAYGIAIVVSVTGRIAREHARGVYDLLGTLPTGRLGVHWRCAVGWLVDHRGGRDAALVLTFIGVIVAFFGVTSLLNTPLSGDLRAPAWVLAVLCATLCIAADFTGTQVSAALIAMLLPAQTTDGANARFGALGAFIGAQMAAYGVLAAAFLGLTALYDAANASSTVIAFTLPPLLVIAFVGAREWIIRRLWRALGRALNATRAEMEALC